MAGIEEAAAGVGINVADVNEIKPVSNALDITTDDFCRVIVSMLEMTTQCILDDEVSSDLVEKVRVAFNKAVDARVQELGERLKLRAEDNHCGHIHYVKLGKGI